jgi:hypothetical protein
VVSTRRVGNIHNLVSACKKLEWPKMQKNETYFLSLFAYLLSMSGMRHDGINTSIRTAGSALSATTSTFTSAPPMDAGRAAAKVQAVTRGKKTRSEISMSPPVVSSSQPANRSPSSPDKLGNSSSRSSRASSPTSILRGERILIQHESAQTDLSGDTVEAARSHMAIVVAAANDAVAITAAEAAKDVAEVMAIVHAEKHAREEIERHSIPNSESFESDPNNRVLRSNIREALSAGTTHGAIKLPKGEGLAAATLYCSSRLCCSRVEQPRLSLHLKCAVRYVTVRGRL